MDRAASLVSISNLPRKTGHDRQGSAVNDADFKRQRVDAFDTTEIHAIAIPVVCAVTDVDENPADPAEIIVEDVFVPYIDRQITAIGVRHKIVRRHIARRQDGAASHA